jgi:hypothetical protein
MPTKRKEVLQSGDSGVGNIGMIQHHFVGPLGDRARKHAETGLTFWLRAGHPANGTRGSAFAA